MKQGIYNKKGELFFSDIEAIATQAITTYLDASADTAEQIAHEIAHQLNQNWGGSMFYVPKFNAWQAHKRDLAIWQDFNGRNHTELAQKYGLSVPYIYEILARIRSTLPKNQHDLFDDL